VAGPEGITRYPIRSILRDGLHRQAAAGATWNFAGTVVARVIALVATVALVRILGPTRFGGIALVQSTAAALATLSGLGLAFATTRFVSENLATNRRRSGSYLTSSVLLCAFSGTVLALVVFLLSPQLASDVLGKKSLAPAMAMASPLLLFSPLGDVLIAGITGLQRFRALGRAQGVRGVLDGLLLIFGALAGGVVGGIAGYVAAEATACVVAAVMVRRAARSEAIRLNWVLDRAVLPSLIRFAVPSLSTSLLLTFSLWMGQIFLAHQPGGLVEVGVFAFAQRFYLAALFIPQVIGTVLFPMLSSLSAAGNLSRFRRLFTAYLATITSVSIAAAAALFLLAGFIAALRGHGGGSEARTLGVMALVAIPSAINNALSQASVALRRIGWWLFSDVILAIVLLAAAWILVPHHGSVGLALAYLAGYIATCIVILPAFIGIPPDTPHPAAESAVSRVNWDVVLPLVGTADALPQLPINPEPPMAIDEFPPTIPTLHRHRIRLTAPEPRRSLAPPAILAIAFLGVLIWSVARDLSSLDTYPVLVLGPIVFFAVQLVSPRARLRLDTPLCPANWAWLLFAVQLVVEPSLVIIFGPAYGQLHSLPNPKSIDVAFLISCLAYIAFSFGLGFILRRPPIAKSVGGRMDDVAPGAVIAFIVLGLAGLVWRFHSPGQLFSYFTGGYSGQTNAATSTSFSDAASTFLRPLGAYGFILLWARSAESARVHRLRFILAGTGALVILATYNYNRAAVVIPLVALAASYGRHIRKLKLRSVIVFGLVILLVGLYFGNYRRVVQATEGGQISVQVAGVTSSPSIESQIQLYGAAPQFNALVIQGLPTIGGFALGRTMVSSALYPLPVIGKPFRASSGTVRYNTLVYGHSGNVDQVLPFMGELYWNFGPLGVAIGFVIVGMVLAAFQRRFDASGGILAAFIFQYFGMWIAFLIIGSLQVVAQILVYFTLPIVALMLAPKVRRREPLPSLPEEAKVS